MVSYTLTDPGPTYRYWVFINELCPLISTCSFKILLDSLINQFNANHRDVFSRVGAPERSPKSLIPTTNFDKRSLAPALVNTPLHLSPCMPDFIGSLLCVQKMYSLYTVSYTLRYLYPGTSPTVSGTPGFLKQACVIYRINHEMIWLLTTYHSTWQMSLWPEHVKVHVFITNTIHMKDDLHVMFLRWRIQVD